MERMYASLMKVINEYKDKRILIVTHSTSVMYLLGTWCSVTYGSDYKFNDRVFFDEKWNYCQTFKLEFDDNFNLHNVENIKI